MQTKRIAIWLIVAAIAVATFSYISATRETPTTERARVLFVTGGESPFWRLTAAGATAAAEHHQVDLTTELPSGGQQQQNEILKAMDPKDFDGVAISPRSPETQNDLLRKIAAKVHLITYDSDAPDSDRLCYVGSDNYSAGRLAAQLTRQAVPEGGKVAVLVATFDKDNAVMRMRGYREEIDRVRRIDDDEDPPTYEVLEPLEDGIDREKCRENIRETLKQHPDVTAFVGMFSYHGPVLLEVFDELLSENKPQLIVFDEEEAVLDGLANGRVFAAVVQDPFKYGYESVRMLAALESGRTLELPIAGSGSLFLPCEAITAENVDAFRERLAKRVKP